MLTVAFHTGRRDPKFEWLFSSLAIQKGVKRVTQIIIVDFYAEPHEDIEWSAGQVLQRVSEAIYLSDQAGFPRGTLRIVPPKPSVWQGPHRVTKENWWAMSSARNTSFALCKNDWIVLLDDRCVLQPDYIQCVKSAMARKYIVFGSYQKQHGLVVERGVITKQGTATGVDNREQYAKGKVIQANGAYAYGCSLALPLEWALKVNGYPEQADSLGFEDILFGMILHNNKFPMRYNQNMRVIQDRTPSELDKPFKRSDKGVSPNDKSHASLEVIGGKKRSENGFELRELRANILAGKPFPLPSNPNPTDWYDQTPIKGL